MTNTNHSSVQAIETKVQEDEKTLKSLRSLGSFITLGAWASVWVGYFSFGQRLHTSGALGPGLVSSFPLCPQGRFSGAIGSCSKSGSSH